MSIQKEIIAWLHTRPDWQQEAALRILTNGTISNVDISDLVALCKSEDGQKITKTRTFPSLVGEHGTENEIRLVSIGDICGIENLAPRKPLMFGDRNLTVIYGNNGSGKSGYSRILKKICGNQHAADLRSNVYEEPPAKQCCTIKFNSGGKEQSVEWLVVDKPIQELQSVDIFDADCGKFYLSKENEASYTPPAVALFDEMVQVCAAVKKQLQNELDTLPSLLPAYPPELADTQAIRKYQNLRPTENETSLAQIMSWNDEDKETLQDLEERLKADDPARLATRKRAKRKQLDSIISKLDNAIKQLSPEACKAFVDIKIEAKRQRDIAIAGAKATLDSANLEGVGSDTWRALWEAARRYSKEAAYPDHSFPYTDGDTHCVLCQQPLAQQAKDRLIDFERFIKGDLERVAQTAEKERDKLIAELPVSPSEEELNTACQAAGLGSDVWLPHLLDAWKGIDAVVQNLKEIADETVPQGLSAKKYPWIEEGYEKSKSLEMQASQYDKDTASFDREKVINQKKELLAKKWTFEQKKSIKAEIQRLQKIDQLSRQIKSTNPRAISSQAGTISEKLITEAYIDRFNNELKILSARNIRVELVKTRTSLGKTLHAVRLKGVKDRVTALDILSEGERRIVALAAFLADVTGKVNKSPFIFDDPISSLDQDYEEKTIERLIALSVARQVIIFTHRLSFLSILSDKATPETVCIRHEPWGAGEPGDIPIFGKKPDSALKKLRDERLKQAEKALKQDGNEAYYPLAKAICSDIRILVERIVELVFLGDVIQRHRRAVNTVGKIGKLAKIKPEDCTLIDTFMGKYSCYEHSQSNEAPIDNPNPEELREDIETLLSWHDEFKTRAVKVSI